MNLGRFYGSLQNGSNAERASTSEIAREGDGVEFLNGSDIYIANNQDHMNKWKVRS